MSKKDTPKLPEAVAAKYNCTITPTTVTIQTPKEIAGKYDLTQISLQDADKLAKHNKYLVAKSKESAK